MILVIFATKSTAACYTDQFAPNSHNAVFVSLSSTANIAKKSSATGCYTRTIFRATSSHCKSALQIDQCNATFKYSNRARHFETVDMH